MSNKNCAYGRSDCMPCTNCDAYIPTMTNADRIRAMSDEELAVFLADEVPHGDCYDCDLECCTYREGDKFYSSCQNAFYKWLKQPYKEEKA